MILKRLAFLLLLCCALLGAQSSIPGDAVYWPTAQGGPTVNNLPGGPLGPFALGYQQNVLDQTFRFVEKVNEIALQNFDQACANYKATRLTRPDFAIAKPDQRTGLKVEYAWTKVGTKDTLDPAVAKGSADLYVWTRPGGPLGSACIDPVPPPPPAGNVHVGQALWGGYYRVMLDDTAAPGTQARAADGMLVVKVCSLGGCWYKAP